MKENEPVELKNMNGGFGLAVAMAVFLFGIILGILTRSTIARYICFLGASLFLGLMSYAVFWFTPRFIRIEKEGVLLRLYFGRERFLPWNEIRVIGIGPHGSRGRFDRYLKGGYVSLNKWLTYPLTLDVAHSLREAYAKRMGRYPSLTESRH